MGDFLAFLISLEGIVSFLVSPILRFPADLDLLETAFLTGDGSLLAMEPAFVLKCTFLSISRCCVSGRVREEKFEVPGILIFDDARLNLGSFSRVVVAIQLSFPITFNNTRLLEDL